MTAPQPAAPSIDNPLDGVLPDFGVFGTEFTELWQKLVGGVWALGIVASIVFLIFGIVAMGAASTAGNPVEYKLGRLRAVRGAIALACLAGLAVIVGAILAIVG